MDRGLRLHLLFSKLLEFREGFPTSSGFWNQDPGFPVCNFPEMPRSTHTGTAPCHISGVLTFFGPVCFSVQLSLLAWSCSTLWGPMDCGMPGLPVHHQLPELVQTHACQVSDAIQPSYPLLPPSHAFNLSQHQGLFQWVSSLHHVAKILECQLQHQSFQWIFTPDFL